MMTRQNFEALANVIADQMEGNSPVSEANFIAGYARATIDLGEAIADVCEASNPLFNREAFLRAAMLK